MDNLCPVCGECEMNHWNMGIYECPECGSMIPMDETEGDELVD